MIRSINNDEKICVVRYEDSFHLALDGQCEMLLHQHKFKHIADAVDQVSKVLDRGVIETEYWNGLKADVHSIFLLSKGKKKQKAHLWNGIDTFCRMWSTGGLNTKKGDFILSSTACGKEVCSLCKNKAPEGNHYLTEVGFVDEREEITLLEPNSTEINYIRKSKIYTYVLALEGGLYYVGQAIEPVKRINSHFNGKGASWTKLHPPTEVLSIEPTETTNWKIAETIENSIVLDKMVTHGWKKVRGGFWSSVDEVAIGKTLVNQSRYLSSLGFDVKEILKP